MSENLIIAIISAGPVFLITIVTIITNAIMETKKLNHESKLQLITRQRIDWIETLRNDFAELTISIYNLINHKFLHRVEFYGKDDLPLEQTIEFHKVTHEMTNELFKKRIIFLSRLNPIEDEELIKSINELYNYSIEESPTCEGANPTFGKIERQIHSLLKAEWEKVKQETGFKKSILKAIQTKIAYYTG